MHRKTAYPRSEPWTADLRLYVSTLHRKKKTRKTENSKGEGDYSGTATHSRQHVVCVGRKGRASGLCQPHISITVSCGDCYSHCALLLAVWQAIKTPSLEGVRRHGTRPGLPTSSHVRPFVWRRSSTQDNHLSACVRALVNVREREKESAQGLGRNVCLCQKKNCLQARRCLVSENVRCACVRVTMCMRVFCLCNRDCECSVCVCV